MTPLNALAVRIRRRFDGQRPEVWSPYGHEKARRELLLQRRIQLVLVGLALAVLYGVISSIFFLDTQTQLQQSSMDVDLDTGLKPITVLVSPGGAPAFASPEAAAPDATDDTPGFRRPAPNPVLQFLQPILSILAPLAIALLGLNRVGASATGKLAEVNFGVFKGAMPYELHAAGKARARVFTHREVDGSVFGKERTDFLFGTYLGSPPAGIERAFGDPREQPAAVHRFVGRAHGTTDGHTVAPVAAAQARTPTARPVRWVDARRRG